MRRLDMKKSMSWALLLALFTTACVLAVSFGRAVTAQDPAPKAKGAPVSSQTKKPKVIGAPAPTPTPTPDLGEDPDEANENDPDRPQFSQGIVNQAEYMRRRDEWVNIKLGMEPGKPYDPSIRENAVMEMKAQEEKMQEDVRKGLVSPHVLSSTGWINIGPFPLANGQTNTVEVPTSGRTIAIAVHPTNPDIVYVGAAQGGLYRSLNGGQTWTQLFDTADSQVIGAIAIAPSNPEIVYVGTGENGQCGSGCYAGVGVYRIDNASTTADLTGPINPLRNYNDSGNNPVSTNIFTGRAISKILVTPNDPSIIFVATASAIVGNVNQSPGGGTVPPTGLRGIYRLGSATGPAAGVTATKLTVNPVNCFDTPCTGNHNILDMVFDLNDPTGNTIVCWARPIIAVGDGGVFR